METAKIEEGSLVEIVSAGRMSGVRLYVVKEYPDCDGAPLYALCHDKNDTIQERQGFGNSKWVMGIPPESLKIIKY